MKRYSPTKLISLFFMCEMMFQANVWNMYTVWHILIKCQLGMLYIT